MKAVVYKGNGNTLLVDVEEPNCLNGDDVKIKIAISGICGTDINVIRGLFPAKIGVVLGHEAVGHVTSFGKDVRHLKVGQPVIIDPTYYCGNCRFCSNLHFNLCDNKIGFEVGIDMDGTHSEYIVMPDRFVYPIPDGIDLEKAVFSEPLACVLNNISASGANLQDVVVIFGAGPIGTICAMVMEKVAYQTIVVETNRERVQFAKQIIRNVVDASHLTREEMNKEVLTLTKNKKPDVIIDSVGNSLETSMDLIDKGGRIVIMGFNNSNKTVIPTLKITIDAIKIIGAGDYNRDIQRAIELLNVFPLEKLITHRVTLDEHENVFKSLRSGNMDSPMMKVVFKLTRKEDMWI